MNEKHQATELRNCENFKTNLKNNLKEIRERDRDREKSRDRETETEIGYSLRSNN